MGMLSKEVIGRGKQFRINKQVFQLCKVHFHKGNQYVCCEVCNKVTHRATLSHNP